MTVLAAAPAEPDAPRRPSPAPRPAADSRQVVVVPPYPGEFGWELMNWHARVRQAARQSPQRRFLVLGEADRRALYAAPGVEFVPLPRPVLPGEASDDRRVDESGAPLDPAELSRALWDAVRPFLARCGLRDEAAPATPHESHWCTPDFQARLHPTRHPYQHFVSLRRPVPDVTCGPDVLLVCRSRRLGAHRNCSPQWWTELSCELRRRGITSAFCPDMLDSAIAALSNARLAAGGSTGGLHLASLCECPHFVWGDGDHCRGTAWEMSLRQRYETLWNPLGTPVVFAPLGWNPSVHDAADGIRDALHRIGRGPAYESRIAPFRRRWAWKRRAARLALAAPHERPAIWRRAPWRLRRWLWEQCI